MRPCRRGGTFSERSAAMAGPHDSPSGPACSWHTWPPMALPCQGRAISCLVTRTEETYYYSQNSQTSWLGFE